MADWVADPGWRTIDFLSDLHLAPELARTTETWAQVMLHSQADALCLLGDVFEAWVGDDSRHQPFEQHLTEVLRQATQRRPVFFIAGNRDFLVGPAFCAAAGLSALPDPTCLHAWGRRWVLAHGDAQCLADARYQAFRAQVRSPEWQREFLARPLDERLAIAQAMRRQSTMSRSTVAEGAGDLDAEACRRLLRQAGAAVLIHGHTHRPATHDLGDGLSRHVLSDWDLDDAASARAEVTRLTADGRLHRLAPEQSIAADWQPAPC